MNARSTIIQSVSDRENEIFAATLALVSELGLLGTTISQIARRAKASPGIIYHYFESKDEIVHQLYGHLIDEFGRHLLRDLQPDLDYRSWFVQVWLNAYAYFVNHPQAAMYIEQYKNSAYHGAVPDPADSNPDFQQLIVFLNQAILDGYILPLPLLVIYELTLGRAVALAKLAIAGEAELDPDTLSTIAERILASIDANS